MGFFSFSEWREVISNFFSGAVAGAICVSSAQPFDTLNVRMQMSVKRERLSTVIKDIYKKEGFFSYYKGMLSPLLVSFPLSAVTFTSYEMFLRSCKNYDANRGPTFWQSFLGGMFAGFTQSFILTPADVVKCTMQMQFDYLPQKYKNSIHCAKSFYRSGGIPKLYKGLMATFARDIPQYGGIFLYSRIFCLVFLSSYELMKQKYKSYYKSEDISLKYEFLAGCISGFLCICVSYPQDMIRTRVMCDADKPKHLRKYKSRFMDGGIMSCAKYIYKRTKLRGFWYGFSTCAINQIVACATQIVGYDNVNNLFMKMTEQYV